MLTNKNILVGITGGIAAYKIPEFVRRLKDQGAVVRVVMTNGAKAFITPLTLQAVSGNAVADDLLDPQAELAMGHIELAKWAELIIIAPASADFIARFTAGMANDLLSTVCLASAAPIAIAPAMNQQMWHNAATQENIQRLAARGIIIWGPGAGEQACGDVGLGRMLEPDALVQQCIQYFQTAIQTPFLAGQHWLITAGPTREAIDPVRYISNHSSGKMGYAIAQAALTAGAKVTLISGPVNLAAPAECQLLSVQSAEQMLQCVMNNIKQAQVFVACAAVADYRLASIAEQKIKKTANTMQLELIKNPDIVASVAALANKPFTVGFAAETEQVNQHAKDKLARKKLDLIAANDVSNSEQGFNSDNNALTVFSASEQIHIPLASKAQVASQLVALIAEQYQQHHSVDK